MSKIQYKFNPRTLTYERVKSNWRRRLLVLGSYLVTGSVFAVVTMLIAYQLIDSPKEIQLKRELESMELQYEILDKKMNQLQLVLSDLQERDNNIYRTILEAEPIPEEVRKAGFGGYNRYKKFDGLDHSGLLKETTKKLDQITKQLYVQSKSLDEIVKLSKGKEAMIQSIPAIMPINQKFLNGLPGSFGYRVHPVYKTQNFHGGMDFAAKQGTPIYATGDGVVERADDLAQGYGNHVVINHGFGYKTLYGHMVKFATTAGKKVKRGELIGYVGSTGLSTGPHVHYEVIKNGERINPINFYYGDLSSEEYQQLLEIASKSTQSFD